MEKNIGKSTSFKNLRQQAEERRREKAGDTDDVRRNAGDQFDPAGQNHQVNCRDDEFGNQYH